MITKSSCFVFLLFNYLTLSLGDVGLVNIPQGKLFGRVHLTISNKSKYYSFQGIPYAEPPVGDLQFMPPKPHTGWDDMRTFFEPGDVCIQMKDDSDDMIGSEDCLFLNVYSPTMKNEGLPVMFFIHGGYFRSGSGNTDFYGPDYFIDENVLLITLNYRLGALGFMDFESDVVSGNMGLKDILLALKWVQENIRSFGGDPDNVTIFGQGSGGVAVDILYLSPSAKGLFHKAILQSGTALVAPYFLWSPKDRAHKLARAMKYEPTDDASLLKTFRNVEPKDLNGNISRTIDIDEPIMSQIGIVVFSPSLSKSEENGFITKLPEEIIANQEIPNLNIPIMIGFNSEESILSNHFFIQRPQFIKNVQKRYPYMFPLRGLYATLHSNYYYEIQHRLKWYYFNSTIDISKDTILKEYLNYLSDDHVIPIDKSVKEYARISKAPVYFYRFSYEGGLNYFKEMATKPLHDKLDLPVHGASEKDELCYLFKCYKIFERYGELHKDQENEDSADYKTIQKMVRLWTNFAKTGNPTPSKDDSILGDLVWEPATGSRQYFLDIDKDLELGLNPHFDNVEFWDAMYEYYTPLATGQFLVDPPKNATTEKDEL